MFEFIMKFGCVDLVLPPVELFIPPLLGNPSSKKEKTVCTRSWVLWWKQVNASDIALYSTDQKYYT